jgi:hypothetical protein
MVKQCGCIENFTERKKPDRHELHKIHYNISNDLNSMAQKINISVQAMVKLKHNKHLR